MAPARYPSLDREKIETAAYIVHQIEGDGRQSRQPGKFSRSFDSQKERLFVSGQIEQPRR